MKKLIFISLLCAAQTAFATGARVNTLGGETAMLPDDDTNIDLFPQSINKFNLFRINNVDTYNSAGYAIVTGDPGDKWGFYGGQGEVNDFINIYRSFGANSAAKIGFLYSTPDQDSSSSNNEPSPGNSSSSASADQKSLGIDVLYGMTQGTTEYSFQFLYDKGPHTIDALAASLSNYGTSTTNGTLTSSTSGSAEAKVFGIGAAMRKPQSIWIFNNLYAEASYSKYEDSSSYNTTSTAGVVTTVEDDSYDISTLYARALLFNEKSLGTGTRLIYGLGAHLTSMSGSISNYAGTLAGGTNYYDNNDQSSLSIGGPQIRIGLEKDIKYGVLRFGVERNINFYSDTSSDWTLGGSDGTPGNTVDDTTSVNSGGIGTNGDMTVRTGWGLEYDNLKIDIMLTDTFWRSGPQMIFDSSLGSIGTRADIVYTF